MNIGEAVKALKEGKRVTRPGWNGKGMWLAMVDPNPDCPESVLRSSERLEFVDPKAPLEQVIVEPFVGMFTADKKMVPWLCSQTDLLAEDWIIVEEGPITISEEVVYVDTKTVMEKLEERLHASIEGVYDNPPHALYTNGYRAALQDLQRVHEGGALLPGEQRSGEEPECGHVDTWMFDRLDVEQIETDDPENIGDRVFRLIAEELDREDLRNTALTVAQVKAIGEQVIDAAGVHGIIVKCTVCNQEFCIST